MDKETYLNLVKGRAGQFIRLKWRRPVTLAAAHRSVRVEKETETVARTGIDYENILKVQCGRASGELPAENQGLPFGEWSEFPYIISHNGTDYARIYPAPNKVPSVTWYVNGNVVDKQVAVSYMRPADARRENERASDLLCFTVKLENMESVAQ